MGTDINWLAVLVGVVAHQALGALWYGVLFRDAWIRAMGMDPEKLERESPGNEMLIGAAASIISVIALALLMSPLDDPTVGDGLLYGAVAGVGLVGAATVMNGAYEQKKPVVTFMFGAYYTLGLMIAGAVLGAWS